MECRDSSEKARPRGDGMSFGLLVLENAGADFWPARWQSGGEEKFDCSSLKLANAGFLSRSLPALASYAAGRDFCS